ncbi:trypsin-like serine protease, partial [Paraclostridium dentum]|uniref:trypsin-like serine protease n=1 Tax=Paraclostridium dentum TaxID=2662455 RepID=UPI003F3CFB78
MRVCFHTVPLKDPETLQELKINIVSQSACKAQYPDLTSDMLCAGDMSGGKDACKVSFTILQFATKLYALSLKTSTISENVGLSCSTGGLWWSAHV